MSRSIYYRLSKPLAVLVGFVLLSGCSGQENIPLKKVDFVIELPKDYKEKRKQFQKGPSSKIGHDPSGVNRSGMPPQ